MATNCALWGLQGRQARHERPPEIEFVKVKDQFRFDLDRRWTERSPHHPTTPSNYDVFCYFQFLQQIHYFTLRWRFLIRTLSATSILFIIGMTRSGIKLSWFHDIGAWLLLITGPVDTWCFELIIFKGKERLLILEGLLFLILWLLLNQVDKWHLILNYQVDWLVSRSQETHIVRFPPNFSEWVDRNPSFIFSPGKMAPLDQNITW